LPEKVIPFDGNSYSIHWLLLFHLLAMAISFDENSDPIRQLRLFNMFKSSFLLVFTLRTAKLNAISSISQKSFVINKREKTSYCQANHEFSIK